jgi:multidrug resistance efflux pump
MSTTFDIGLETVARPKKRLAAIPRRASSRCRRSRCTDRTGRLVDRIAASSVSTDDAYVKADSTIVAPKIQGLVAQILVRDNQHVVAGQPLIRIDSEDYQQAVMAAQADLESAQATLSQQDAQQGLAAANVRAAEATIRSSDAEKPAPRPTIAATPSWSPTVMSRAARPSRFVRRPSRTARIRRNPARRLRRAGSRRPLSRARARNCRPPSRKPRPR